MQNTSGLIPLGRAVLVEPLESSDIKSAIIAIPETARERLMMAEQQALVVAVGPEAWKDEAVPRAMPGDRVMISKYAGTMTVGPLDKKQYRVINCNDVFLRILD